MTDRTIEEVRTGIRNAPAAKPDATREAVLIPLNTVEPRTVRCFWAPYIIQDELNLLYGDAGRGKSYFTHALIAANSLGHPLPGEDGFGEGRPVRPPASSAIISAEDGLPEVIVPRLTSLGADLSKVHAITGVTVTTPDGKAREVSLTLDDVPVIEAAIQRIGDLNLLVIDPVQSYVPSSTDMYRGNEFRPLLEDLARLALKHGVTIILVTHMNRNTGAKSNYRVSNSQELVNRSRSVLVLAEDPNDNTRRIVAHDKHNYTMKGTSIAFEIREDGRFYWAGTSDLTADQLLAQPVSNEERGQRDEATEWLREALSNGPVPARELKQAAQRDGMAWRTIERAKTDLSIKPRRASHGNEGSGQWLWGLPADEHETPPTSYGGGLAVLPETPTRTTLSQDSQDSQVSNVAALPERRPGRQDSQEPQDRQADSSRAAALLERCMVTAADFATLDLEALRERYVTAHPHADAPSWWPAKTEPQAVTVAVHLLAEDRATGSAHAPASVYLQRAREAVAAVSREKTA